MTYRPTLDKNSRCILLGLCNQPDYAIINYSYG